MLVSLVCKKKSKYGVCFFLVFLIGLKECRYIYYLPAGRSVLRKTVPEVLSTARGCSPRAVLKTEGTVFLNTDRPRPANNFLFFSCCFSKVKRVLLFSESNVLQARVK